MYRVPPALAPVTYLPGLIYEAAIRARNRLYASAKLPQYRLPRPVISVGNITLGGSGKTPLVIFVARVLEKLGYTPAVLTRGYRRSRPRETNIVAPGETIPDAAAALGDEPALIQRHVPSAWLGVSKNRLEAGKRIAERDPEVVFLLDDGFQHRKLHRDLDIVVVDTSQPLKFNRIFPSGTLREPLSGLHRCDMIVFLGSQDGVNQDKAGLTPQDLIPETAIFYCNQRIQALVPFSLWKLNSPDRGKEVDATAVPQSAYLVCAVGNPERFQRDIRRMGIGGPGGSFFPDHHVLRQKDWQNCADRARRKGAETIITTEKDAIKIVEPPDFRLFVAVQSTEMVNTEEFGILLNNCVKGSL
jgi:tetraacyldisaccharide 4'-kinase